MEKLILKNPLPSQVLEKFSRLASSTQGSLPPGKGTKLMEEPSEALKLFLSSGKPLCTQPELRKG